MYPTEYFIVSERYNPSIAFSKLQKIQRKTDTEALELRNIWLGSRPSYITFFPILNPGISSSILQLNAFVPWPNISQVKSLKICGSGNFMWVRNVDWGILRPCKCERFGRVRPCITVLCVASSYRTATGLFLVNAWVLKHKLKIETENKSEFHSVHSNAQ